MPKPEEVAPFYVRGFPANVVIEIQMKKGVLRIPIGDLAIYVNDPVMSEVRIPLGLRLNERITEYVTEVKYHFGDRV